MARKHAARVERLESFALRPGRKIGPRYQVVQKLGGGIEGEVYQKAQESSDSWHGFSVRL